MARKKETYLDFLKQLATELKATPRRVDEGLRCGYPCGTDLDPIAYDGPVPRSVRKRIWALPAVIL